MLPLSANVQEKIQGASRCQQAGENQPAKHSTGCCCFPTIQSKLFTCKMHELQLLAAQSSGGSQQAPWHGALLLCNNTHCKHILACMRSRTKTQSPHHPAHSSIPCTGSFCPTPQGSRCFPLKKTPMGLSCRVPAPFSRGDPPALLENTRSFAHLERKQLLPRWFYFVSFVLFLLFF